LFRSIVDYTYDWEYFVDLNGDLKYVSPSCERITGFSPKDFIDNSRLLESITHENDKANLEIHLNEELKLGKSISFDFRIISKDGKEHWIEHYCQPAYDSQGNLIGRRASNREITEKKRILEELSRLNSLNKSILNASSLGIAVYEYLGKCIYINKVAADKIGATIEQGLNQNFRFLESWKKSGLLDYALKALEFNSIEKFELKTTTTFGKDVWLDCSLIPFISNNEKYLMIVFDDISIRKNMELQLKKSHDELELKVAERTKELNRINILLNEELKKTIQIGKETIKEKEFLNSLLDTAGGIVVVLDKNANIVLFNNYAEKLTGYVKKEVIGKNWFDLFIPKTEYNTIKDVFEDVIKNLPEYSNYENKILTKDGKELLINWSNTIVKNDKGEPTGTLSFGIDFTLRKDLEVKYNNIYNTMNEGMALHKLVYDFSGNPIDYVLLDVNPAFERITNLKKENIIGYKATEIYGTKDPPYLEIYSKVVKTGDPTKFEIYFAPMGKYFNISVFSPENNKFVTIFEDITARKKSEESLKKIEWLLTKEFDSKQKIDEPQSYGDLTELNSNRLILDSVGKETLSYIVSDYLDLLDTSSAIYEKNGDYAYRIFSAGWCKLLDQNSRELCNTNDNKEALKSGKWHCHESCWAKASKIAIENKKPVDIECLGGIHLFAVPIFAKNEVIGSINFGYGEPPKDLDRLNKVSSLYKLDVDKLKEEANKYETRPKFIIEIAKKRLLNCAKLIGEIVERRMVEQSLKESENTLNSLFNSAPIGICLLKNRVFQWLNPKLAEIVGYEQQELIGKETKILYDSEEEYERVGKILYSVDFNNPLSQIESKLKRKDGILIDCVTSISPLDPSDHSKGFITTLMDITEKKKMENEINKISKFPAENPNPILRVSFDGELLYANNSSLDLLSFWKISIGDTLPNELADEIKEVLSRNQKISKDMIINDKIFLFEFVPIINEQYVNIYGKDVTAEKIAEQSLKESEEKFKKFFEKNPDYCYLLSPEGTFIDINESALKVLGYNKNELIGKHRSVIYSSESIQKMNQIFTKFEKIGHIEDEEITVVSKNGEKRIVLLSSLKINDEKGKWINSISIQKDITEMKKAESELLIYQTHLEELVAERTSRLESINKELESFSYSVSHDLRAPLRAIDGFGQALVEEYADKLGEDGVHYIDRIRKATQKMANLIDDMLRLSRISRTIPKKEEVDLSELAKEILSELTKLNKERKVKIKIQEGIKLVGDYNLLKIMMENLLNNSWKFTSKKEDAIIEFGAYKKEEKTIYYIKDNGVGFDQEYADKLFVPFQRLHSEEDFPGTGVGLANVNRIINMHGGKIWAEGKINQGATFYFII